MNAPNTRDYANRSIEANRILLESAEDVANISQVAQANRNIADIQYQQDQILNRFDQMLNHFYLEQCLDRIEQRFDHFETRFDEISVVSTKAVNANCVKPGFQI